MSTEGNQGMKTSTKILDSNNINTKIVFFEIDRVVEDLAKYHTAPCATTWFKIMNKQNPSLQEYRAKVIEFMNEFENILSARLPKSKVTEVCLERVRKLLREQVLLVSNGKSKDVEKRFEYYTKPN